MKNLINFVLLILIVFGVSCSKDEINNDGVHISTGVLITVVDQQGSDLLDTSNTNYLKREDIKIFHMIDGELTEYSEGLLDCPKGFRIYNPNDLGFNEQYVFCLQRTDASYHTGELESLLPITYIQWNESDTDTVQCQYSKTRSSLVTIKVWFNGNEVWDIDDMENNDPRWFQTVKN